MKGFALTGTLIAVGASALFAGLGYFISITNKLENNQKETWVDLREKGEKISAMESTVSGLDKRLERIDNKLDLILQLK